jgi:hypothetical protein
MNAVTGLLGLGGSGASQASLQKPVTEEMARQAGVTSNDALAQQLAFAQAVQQQNGLGNQSNVFNQLSNVASGTGPNPAQAQLANATGANVANQAALMAGQRGAAANPALIARQAAMQGGNLQQQAAGQGAALQAQQSLNALGQMGNIAGQQANQQAGATNAYTQAAQGNQGMLLNSIANQNQNALGNAGLQQQYESQKNQMAANAMGQLTGALGSGLGMMGGGSAGGGGGASAGTPDIAKYAMMAAEGGQVPGPQSKVGQHFHGIMMASGGQVPALVSPGERYLPPQDVKKVAQGKESPMAAGEKIPGEAKVKGAKNSYANDTVPKTLQEGGIVIPRSVTQSKDPHKKAMEFVSAVLAKQGIKPKSGK